MVISFKEGDLEITDKAVGVLVKHNGVKKTMWIPKTLITHISYKHMHLDVEDWFYDKKMNELF